MLITLCTLSLLLFTRVTFSSEEHKLKIYALEKGIIVEEKVDVKPNEKTIEISMPAHNNLDKMILVADFNQGLTVRYMPDFNICYLTHLDREQFPDPESLAQNIKKNKDSHSTEELWLNTPNITYTYNIDPVAMKSMENLNDRMKELCDGVPIHFMEKIKDDQENVEALENGIELHPLNSDDDRAQRRQRDKRQTFCNPDLEKSACLLQNKFCHYVKNCELKFDKETLSEFEDCGKKHEFGKARCCRICCNDAAGASDDIPYCKKLQIKDMLKYCQLS